MANFLPTQEPGPGPTDAPLPTYQSYSAYTTSIYDVTTTITRIAYDPQATAAPSVDVQTQTYATTSIGYSVVNIPLLYDGPLPPPPLGTLFTTANQRIVPSPTQTQPAQPQPTTPPGGSNGNGNGNGSGSNGSGGGSNQGSGDGSGSNGSGGGSNQGSGDGSGSNGSGSGSNQGNGNGSNNGGSSGNQGNGGNNGGSTGNGSSQGSGQNSNGGDSNAQGGANQGGQGSQGNNGGGNGSGNGGGNGSGDGSGNGNGSGNGGGNGSGNGNGAGSGGNGGTAAPTPTSPGTPNPASLSSSASAASVAASNASVSASLASQSASNAEQSSAASLASQSAAAASSSASAASASASSLSQSIADGGSGTGTLTSPTSIPTGPGGGNGNGNGDGGGPTDYLASNGLSGGQIAGIVVGVLAAAVLLALLACLLCRRRRRRRRGDEAAALTGGSAAGVLGVGSGMRRRASERWASGFSRGGSRRGDYSTLGLGAAAAAGGAAAGAAAAGGRGSVHSDEFEEDQLSGGHGSGFFVVGGKRGSASQNPFRDSVADSEANAGLHGGQGDDGEMREYGNVAPSAANGSDVGGRKRGLGAAAGLAGLGAGLAAVFGARGRSSNHSDRGKDRRHSLEGGEEEPLSQNVDDRVYVVGRRPFDDDDYDRNGENATAERRGLMQFADADNTADMTGDMSEMRQAGPSRWAGPTASYDPYTTSSPSQPGVGVAAAGAVGVLGGIAATRAHRSSSTAKAEDEASDHMRGWTRHSDAGSSGGGPRSNTGSGSGSGLGTGTVTGSAYGSGSGSGSGPNPSSNSTGQRTSDQHTSESGYTAVGASPNVHQRPQSSPRGERPLVTYGNLAPQQRAALGVADDGLDERPARIPSFTGGFGDGDLGLQEARSSADNYRQSERDEQRRLDLIAAAAAGGAGGLGLGALAAHHRKSQQSGQGSASSHEAVNDAAAPSAPAEASDPRYSRFISQNTPLLGPGATAAAAEQSSHGRSDSYGRHGRLPTIQSVGEFGERGSGIAESTTHQSSGSSAAQSGYGSGRAGQTYLAAPTSPYSPRAAHHSASLGTLGAVTAEESLGHISGEQGNDDGNERETMADRAGDASNETALAGDDAHDRFGEETAAGALAGAGLLGSLAMGWRKLTGSQAGSAAADSEMQRSHSSGGEATRVGGQSDHTSAGRTVASRDSDPNVVHREPHARQRSRGDPGMAAEVQSQRASVHTGENTPLIGQSSPYTHGRSPSGSAKSATSSGQRHAIPQTLIEETEDGTVHESLASPYVDDGNDADDEDVIGDSSGAMATVGGTSRGLTAPSMTARTRSSSDNPYAVSGGTSGHGDRKVLSGTTGDSSMRALRDPVSEEASGRSPETSQSNSLSSGQRRARAHISSSGASTGGASYSPSFLTRHPSGSTHGLGGAGGAGRTGSSSMSSRDALGGGAHSSGSLRRQAYNESEYTSSSGLNQSVRRDTSTLESDGQSSRATAGGIQDDDAHRLSVEQGGGGDYVTLDEQHAHEQRGAYRIGDGDTTHQSAGSSPSANAFYPSESLGAAVRRRAEQEAREQNAQRQRTESSAGGTVSGSPQTATPRALPQSLRVAGGNIPPTGAFAPPVPTTAATLTSASPFESDQWRQSPRVESASQRASQAAAAAGSNNNDDHNHSNDNDRPDDEQDNQRSAWPKFLRF